MTWHRPRAALVACAWLALAGAGPEARWRTGWYAAPFPAIPALTPADRRAFTDQTVRQVFVVEAGGAALRLRLTNELGKTPVAVGAVTLARVDAQGAAVAPMRVTFGGRAGVTIPAGAPMLSDRVVFAARRHTRLAVSVHYAARAVPAAHLQPVDLAQGDQTTAARLRDTERVRAPGIVSAVEVVGGAPVVVAIGDSITEGTPDQAAAHRSWPQQLAKRIGGVTVVNAGVSGSRLLKDGAGASLLARLDRDALTLPGVTHVVLLIGINDIGNGARTGAPVSAEAIIAGYRQVIARAHGRGIRVIGATILPYRGAAYFDEAGEATRRAVNAWVTGGGAFDGTIDFAALVADPGDPSRLAAAYDPGDHLHPNDAGYAAMARAVPAGLFGVR